MCDRDRKGKRENKRYFPHCLWKTVVGDIDALLISPKSMTDVSSEWFPTHLFEGGIHAERGLRRTCQLRQK